MSKSKIAWTEHTWQPVVGCTKVSAGCQNCYAEKMAKRLAYMGQVKYGKVLEYNEEKEKYWGGWNGQTYCDESALETPLKRKKPTMYFVCSMGDIFHESVSYEFFTKVWCIIKKCPQHTFQILTKRPEQMKYFCNGLYEHCKEIPTNIWLGVTAENQEMADKRIPILLQIPAAVRFVSVEPMLSGIWFDSPEQYKMLRGLDWMIVGAESGPKARYCPVENIRGVVEQCKAAGVSVFVKQIHMWKVNWADRLYESPENISQNPAWEKVSKLVLVKDINQFPKDLQIRQMPEVQNV